MPNKRETFQSPYSQYKHLVGLPFDIISTVKPKDEEVGDQYNIRFEGGQEIIAWPEEIYSDTGWNP